MAQVGVALATTSLLLLFVLFSMRIHAHLRTRHHWLGIFNESSLAIILGALISVVMYALDRYDPQGAFAFKHEVFEYLILPPIVFHAAFNLKKRYLHRNMARILAFSILGTMSAVAIVFLPLNYFWDRVGPQGTNDRFIPTVIAVSLSVVEPAPILAELYEHLHLGDPRNAPPPIYSVLLGENLISVVGGVGAARVLFVSQSWDSALAAIGAFFYTVPLSALLGLVLGFVSSGFFHLLDLRKTELNEFAALITFSYGSFFFSDYIAHYLPFVIVPMVSSFVCGLVMGSFTWYNVSGFSRATLPIFVRVFAFVAETYTYLILGSSLFSMDLSSTPDLRLASLSLAVMYVARTVVTLGVYPIVMKLSKLRQTGIHTHWTDLLMLWWAGTRGHVSYGLAVIAGDLREEHQATLEFTIWFCVVVTVVLHGLLNPLVVHAYISKNAKQQQEECNLIAGVTTEAKTFLQRWLCRPDYLGVSRHEFTRRVRQKFDEVDREFVDRNSAKYGSTVVEEGQLVNTESEWFSVEAHLGCIE
eukprot:TRINITY_DN30995_c0_g1_i1.p1 TRINITY_DN30995_c0_g1~~TRINITY_DN30995_c0_g1_i1.p1  ORF type:complete len:530 (+),score=72.21 TRINITY_DN30995_c0_g1_i1:565-2154(+)